MRAAYAVAAVVGLGLVLMTAPLNLPRGIRNNNPGNIRRGADRWQGMRAQQTDPEFIQFEAPEWGIRAMAIILRNYRDRHGLRTLGAMMHRWAPPNENDTAAYIESVAKRSGIAPQQVVRDQDWPRIIAAMIHHENGRQPYDVAQIEKGVSLA